MDETPETPIPEKWAQLRFSVVGMLLAAPPARGETRAEIGRLAARLWVHPITGKRTRFAASTIERWYYQAKKERRDPVGALRRKVRKDHGRCRRMPEKLVGALAAQYGTHKDWSRRLHYDNLAALVKADAALGPLPSYATVTRFMRTHGLVRRRRLTSRHTAGAALAEERLDSREVRSYEATHVNALWHADFHVARRPVIVREGRWAYPTAFGALDDRSRLVCHLQWYLGETAETFAHGLSQAFAKRRLSRALMTDQGQAELAAESRGGLGRLSILHEPTLPYSPFQNGKQESFWGQIEGRLMPMLDGVRDLTLDFLNEATQAWVEFEYNRKVHSEIGVAPLTRYLEGPDVGRPSPASEELRLAFTTQVLRTQRKSDGTLTVEGIRYEVPSAYRHLERVGVRYASWDLSFVHLADPKSGTVLCRLFPVDKARNAEGKRRVLTPGPLAIPPRPTAPTGPAPLLAQLIAEYAATGLPPAYVPLVSCGGPDVEERP